MKLRNIQKFEDAISAACGERVYAFDTNIHASTHYFWFEETPDPKDPSRHGYWRYGVHESGRIDEWFDCGDKSGWKTVDRPTRELRERAQRLLNAYLLLI